MGKTSETGATTIHRSGANLDQNSPNAVVGIWVDDNLYDIRISDLTIKVDSPSIPSTTTYGILMTNNYYYVINRVVMDIAKGSDGTTDNSTLPQGQDGDVGVSTVVTLAPGWGGNAEGANGGAPGAPWSPPTYTGNDGGKGGHNVAFPRMGGSGAGGGSVGQLWFDAPGNGGIGGSPTGTPGSAGIGGGRCQ